jgi:RNA polymerase sigma-70 factor, ECF subfamily
MSEDEIQVLVESARGGDADGFDALYAVFAPRVFRFFRFRVMAEETAEDLTQRVFLKMIEHLPDYRSNGVPFAAWLFRVARNTWIDESRTARATVPLETLAQSAADTGDPEAMASTAYDWNLVREAVTALPPDQREVIACRFFAGLTPQETAAEMGRTEGSVRVLQHRALARLRRRLPWLVAGVNSDFGRPERDMADVRLSER